MPTIRYPLNPPRPTIQKGRTLPYWIVSFPDESCAIGITWEDALRKAYGWIAENETATR